MMKTAVYYSNKDIRLQDMPVPKIGHDEALMRVRACGICGSDVMEWYRIHRVPLVLGHEAAGEITQIGKNVKAIKKGDRVVIAHHVPCNECRFCRAGHHSVCDTLRKTNIDPGGFCEYTRIPQINVRLGTFKLPDNVSHEDATFVEPLACVLRGQRIAAVKSGNTILVIGSGIAGALHIHYAKYKGAGKVVATDISDFRLTLAKKLGADAVFSANDYTPEKLQGINSGRLADTVILCTGAKSAIEQALNSVERGGTILVFAPTDKDEPVTIPYNKLFWRTEITVTSSYAASPDEYKQALGIIASGRLKLKDMITHTLPLEKTGEGFKLVAEAKDSLKVIIKP